MSKYYYHGIEPFGDCFGLTASTIVDILKSGILTRNDARNMNDATMNHVCLYKKNDDYNYDDEEVRLKSVLSGWITNCFVIIISPEIKAEKTPTTEQFERMENGELTTNLIDEWRCYEIITPAQIVGVALPYEIIEEYLKNPYVDQKDKLLLQKSIDIIEEMAYERDLDIENSCDPNFTDHYDKGISRN